MALIHYTIVLAKLLAARLNIAESIRHKNVNIEALVLNVFSACTIIAFYRKKLYKRKVPTEVVKHFITF